MNVRGLAIENPPLRIQPQEENFTKRTELIDYEGRTSRQGDAHKQNMAKGAQKAGKNIGAQCLIYDRLLFCARGEGVFEVRLL